MYQWNAQYNNTMLKNLTCTPGWCSQNVSEIEKKDKKKPLAECLKLSCLPVTEENIDSVEVLKNAVSICKLLDPNNDEILGRNIKRIVDPLESLITGRFLEL